MALILGTLTIQEDYVLVVREEEQEHYGKLSLPTGHHEKGETILAGMIRETKEETGLTVKLTGLLPIQINSKNIVIRATTKIIGGKIGLGVNKNEISEAYWLPIQEFLNMPIDCIRGGEDAKQFIRAYINQQILPIKTLKLVNKFH